MFFKQPYNKYTQFDRFTVVTKTLPIMQPDFYIDNSIKVH